MVFCLMLRAVKSLLFRYLHFCTEFLVLTKNGLTRKLELISKFMTPQTGLQTIKIYILPKILISRGKQTMRFGRLPKYSMRYIFF